MLDLYDLDDGQIGQMSKVLEKVQQRITALEYQKRDLEQIIGELRKDSQKIEEFLNEKTSRMNIRMPDPEEVGRDQDHYPTAAIAE